MCFEVSFEHVHNISVTNNYASIIFQSLVIPEKFQHILRVMGTNIDGNRKVMFAMTAIKGVGRRYANIVLKKADIDLDKRAGECSEEEVSHLFFYKKKNTKFDCEICTQDIC